MGEQSGTQGGVAVRILVVEDHAETAEMLSMVLQDEGYCVTLAETGERALQLLGLSEEQRAGKSQPNLVVLDLGLPDMEGAELARRMREQAGARRPPLVVVSAQQPQVAEETAREIGAAACVHKPFPIDLLLESINLALAHPDRRIPWTRRILARIDKTISDSGLG